MYIKKSFLTALLLMLTGVQVSYAQDAPGAVQVDEEFFSRLGLEMQKLADTVLPDVGNPGKERRAGNIRILETVAGEEIKTFTGHREPVRAVAISQDGKILATGSLDRTIRLWDTKKDAEPKVMDEFREPVTSMVISSDGKYIASGTDGRSFAVRLWDVKKGKISKSFLGHTEPIFALAFSPDGKILASGSNDRTIRLWEPTKEKDPKIFTGSTGQILSLAFSPDGKILASGSRDSSIRIWNAEKGTEMHTLSGHRGPVFSLTFSPDGKYLLSGCEDRTIRIWDTEKFTEQKSLNGHNAVIFSVAFSPDGKTFASAGGDRTVKLWNFKTCKEIKSFPGHRDRVLSVAFGPDGNTLFTGSADTTAKIWDITGIFEITLPSGEIIRAVSVCTNTDRSLTAAGLNDNTIKIWNSEGSEFFSLSGLMDKTYSLTFSPDNSLLASAGNDNSLKVWDLKTGKLLKTLTESSEKLNIMAFSPNGKLLACAGAGKTIKLWDIDKAKTLKSLSGHTDEVYSVSFSPDGKKIASTARDKTLKLWDVDAGTVLLTVPFDKNPPVCAGFHQSMPALIFGRNTDGTAFAFLSSPDKGTDLSEGKPQSPPFPAVKAEFLSSGSIKAGDFVSLKVTADNVKGKGDLFRYCVITECADEPSFDKQLLVFGRVEAGRTADRYLNLRTDYKWPDKSIKIKFKSSESNNNIAPDTDLTVNINASMLRPDFAVDCEIFDGRDGRGVGNADEKIQKGEGPEVLVKIKNTGAGASGNITVELLDFPTIDSLEFFGEKKSELSGISPDESASVQFSFMVKLLYIGNFIRFRIKVREDKCGVEKTVNVDLPVGG